MDRDLVLRRRTQADVARTVGVDRSAVSRHVKNHLLPTLAETVLLETTDVALGNIFEAYDMIYAEGWRLYHMAVASGDLKLAHSLLVDQRKLVADVVRDASKMKGANLKDIIGLDQAAEFRQKEEVREQLIEKLEDLLDRHRDQIPRGDEYWNQGGPRSPFGEPIDPPPEPTGPDDAEPASDAGDPERAVPIPPRKAGKAGMSPLTTWSHDTWEI